MRGSNHLTDRELLMALDGELPIAQRASAAAHLEQCLDCQTRRDQVARAAEDYSTLYRSDLAAPAALHDQARERLRAQLDAIGRTRASWLASTFAAKSIAMPRWAMVGAALVATALMIQAAAPSLLRQSSRVAATVERGALPSPALTPGATWNVSVAELCATGTRELRQVPVAVRQQVLRNYGMEGVPSDEYELDYLITPELGGAPDPRNLWPQRYASRVWNAHVKDELERLLPTLVCDRQIRLEAAQREIARDWIAAYRKYFKTDAPLQADASIGGADDRDLGQSEVDDLRYPVWRSASAPALELVAFSPRR